MSYKEIEAKQKYIEAEKWLAERTGFLPISIKPDMSAEQMHEILMDDFRLLLNDPRRHVGMGLETGMGQAYFSGIFIGGGLLFQVATHDARSGYSIWVDTNTYGFDKRKVLKFMDQSVFDLTLETEKAERKETLEQKKQRALLATYSGLINHFKRNYKDLDVLPDLQMKPGMNFEQMRQVFVEKFKLIAEKAEIILKRFDDRLFFCYYKRGEYRDVTFLTLVINKNSKDYGCVWSGYINPVYKFAGSIYDKQLADYFVQEYDRLFKIERLPEIKPEPKSEPQKKKSLLDNIIGFFKGNSRS